MLELNQIAKSELIEELKHKFNFKENEPTVAVLEFVDKRFKELTCDLIDFRNASNSNKEMEKLSYAINRNKDLDGSIPLNKSYFLISQGAFIFCGLVVGIIIGINFNKLISPLLNAPSVTTTVGFEHAEVTVTNGKINGIYEDDGVYKIKLGQRKK